MITFPLSGNSSLIVIEPRNLARLKEGRPLKVGEHLVCFTPDMQKFVEQLGVELDVANVKRGDPVYRKVRLTPEQLEAALKVCQHLPEIVR